MKAEALFTVDGLYIRDRFGRVVLPRGCNLGGDSKIPFAPPGNPLDYDVSFVGRPFPEQDAADHFARLAEWGFTFLRFVVTWEAVEHAGPGVYDEEYLSYVRAILKKAEEFGISVFIDPHQDVWSRWTGGDGAPAWTLEAAGFDLSRIAQTGAAFTVQSQGADYRPMSWGMNYLRYANATMWTLFFGGNVFAPGRYIMGVPAQEWLQSHFIDAMNHTARRLKDCAAIVGFGTLNEPHMGYIGLKNLASHQRVTASGGAVPSALDTMAAASGFSRNVRRVAMAGALPQKGLETLNPDGVSLFREGFGCPWMEAGVWGIENGEPVAKKNSWFSTAPDGRSYDFAQDFLKPFQLRYMETLSKKHEHYIFFIEGVPMGNRSRWMAGEAVRKDGKPFAMVEAFHWYDGLTLLFKKWRPWLMADGETGKVSVGPRKAVESVMNQIERMASYPRSEGIPALLGEFGVQFDLDGGKSFKTGDWSAQEEALGVYYDAVDASLLPSTIWNYSASNTNEAGDGWNTEDLSLYSISQGGGRAVKGFCRPYAMAVAGVPAKMRFDRKKREFVFEWDAVPADGEAGITEIYVPKAWYSGGWKSDFKGESAVVEERPEANRLFVTVKNPGRARVVVTPAGKEGRA